MADIVPGNASSTVTLAVGSTVVGAIDTLGDHDWYRLTLVAGQTYSFSTSAVDGSGIDTFLTLRSVSGAALASDDDSGPGTFSLLTFTATTSGTYFLDAGAYDDDSTGGFRLAFNSTAAPPGDTAAADTSTSATLALNGSVNGAIEANGDHDWYRVTLVAGQTYSFRTNPTGGGADFDTTLTLRSASGAQLAFNDDGDTGTYSALRFTATTSGTYYIDVGAYGDAEAGAFNLTLAEAAPLTVFTNDQIANQLTNGYWGGSSHHFNVAPGGTLTVNVTALTGAGQTLAREALALWRDATGIVFSEVAAGGQIVFDDSESGAFSTASYSNGITSSAQVNVSTQWLADYGTTLNSYSFLTYVHEIGHALGLGHAGDYNSDASYPEDALFLNDSWSATVMSYFDQSENSYVAAQGFTRQFVVTPTAADGVATTALYGAAAGTRTGDTVYGFNNSSGRAVYDATLNPGVAYTVFDNGGTDTLDYSGFAQAQVVNLAAEAYSNVGGRVGNVSIARGAVIENAIGGSGSDTLTGNAGANRLLGSAGADTLIGLAGNDTLDGGTGGDRLVGGAGDDQFLLDDAGDVVVELAGEGVDTITVGLGAASGGAYVLGDGVHVEVVRAEPGSAAINLIGNGLAQLLVGNSAANILSGNGGADTLDGGLGDDTYRIFTTQDVILDAGGFDTVYASGTSYFLYSTAEVEYLSTAQQAGTDPIYMVGNATAQLIVGNYGDNILNGRGGGNGNPDTLIGLFGNDTYGVFGQGDVVREAAGQGSDVVYANASYQLRSGTEVEALSAVDQSASGAADAFTLIGNEVAQLVIGNGAANMLDGRGGGDTLIGLGGDDVFAFTAALGAGNADVIQDFAAGDRIGLAPNIFAAVTDGGIATGELAFGTAAADADDRLVYDQATGRLFYDADGNGTGAATLFATLAAGTMLSAASFTVIPPVGDLAAG